MDKPKVGDRFKLLDIPESRYQVFSRDVFINHEYGIVEKIDEKRKTVVAKFLMNDGSIIGGKNAFYDSYEDYICEIEILPDISLLINKIEEDLTKLEKRYE